MLRTGIYFASILAAPGACAAAKALPDDLPGAIREFDAAAGKHDQFRKANVDSVFNTEAMARCASLAFKDKERFTIVFVIDEAGHVTRVYYEPKTALGTCLANELRRTSFLVPPEAPFFVKYDINAM